MAFACYIPKHDVFISERNKGLYLSWPFKENS